MRFPSLALARRGRLLPQLRSSGSQSGPPDAREPAAVSGDWEVSEIARSVDRADGDRRQIDVGSPVVRSTPHDDRRAVRNIQSSEL